MDICFGENFIKNEEVINRRNFDANIFNQGKSLYEVIRVIDGIPLFFEKHMYRLNNSAELLSFNLCYSNEKIKSKIKKLIKINNGNIGNIKIVFNFKDDKNDFYGYFLKHSYPSNKEYEEGVNTIFYHGERDNPNAKVINISFRETVDKNLAEKNAFEAILVDNQGYITEGSRSNIFMVKGKKVYTSPLEAVLPGITREVIIDICKKLGYEMLEEPIKYKDIYDMEGVFISGTSPKVLPIGFVEKIKIESSKNQVIKSIMKEYNSIIDKYVSDNI